MEIFGHCVGCGVLQTRLWRTGWSRYRCSRCVERELEERYNPGMVRVRGAPFDNPQAPLKGEMDEWQMGKIADLQRPRSGYHRPGCSTLGCPGCEEVQPLE
jgi:hypothetical protein